MEKDGEGGSDVIKVKIAPRVKLTKMFLFDI